TIHRAENTDNGEHLQNILSVLNEIAEETTVVFPMHPRTKKMIAKNNLQVSQRIKVIEPQDYLSFLALLSASKVCISDSGGIQEEALVFNVPCLIPREETEWMRLVEKGKNFLVGTDPKRIISNVRRLLDDEKELQRIKRISVHYDAAVSPKIIQLIKSLAVHNLTSRKPPL
ncbi:UDP-N-acetylglucosamine 2-epimerase, partial [Candidatus Woesearchaeota archaeon]|nr:UDP-N-acetylglucosamine 2-epimerase [Candidatus Woesearchaeota archaeon]